MTAPAPRICCLDLDTFFVSVERLLDPSLEGKPVIVGGRPGERGVVTACSYEVRAFGVRSGMSLTEAVRLAPHAIYLPVREGTYSDYSARVIDIARRYSPIIRSASIDEFFMDFRGCESLYRRPGDASADATIERVVRELTAAIKAELGLPASAGIATSKPLAKVASGLAKPAGVLLVPAGGEAALLAPLPVRKLPGIGPVAEQKLERLGITTLGELAAAPLPQLERVFGAWSRQIYDAAHGRGDSDMGRDRPAFREHDSAGDVIGSISNERTFFRDVHDADVVEAMLCSLCERVCWRARKRGVKARTVSLKLRYANFETLSRARTIAPTNSELDVLPVIKELYWGEQRGPRTTSGVQSGGSSVRATSADEASPGAQRHGTGGRRPPERVRPVRLLGIALSNLGLYDEQLQLFPGDARLQESVDALREKFGFDAVRLATGRSGGRRGRGHRRGGSNKQS